MTTAEMSDPVPTVWEEEPTGLGYFQISPSGMQHVMQNASERALPVYIVCGGGVDRTNVECARACTHGAKAIEARTGMNRKTCVPALMEELFGIDALRRLPEIADSSTATREAKRHTVTCLVDPDRTDDLVDIDQRFLDPHHGAEKRPARLSVRGVTSDFMRLRYSQGGRRGGRSFTDAMLLYFALHGHFDLERFAAVDPQVAHGQMTPLDDAGAIEGLEHVMPLFYNDGQRLVLVKDAGFPRISDAYAQQLFKDLPSRTGEAPESRAAAALGVLRLLGFVTTAYVLWTASPFTERDAAPVVTLYVKGGSSFTDGRHVAHVIDAVVKETDTIPGSVMYPKGAEDGKSVFSETGIYRYIVDEDEVASSVVLTQLRLKHVADSDSQRAGLVVEKLRRDDYLGYLHSLARV